MSDEQLIVETMEEARNYVSRFLDGLDSIVESFLKGREDLAFRDYPHFIEGIGWLMEVLRLTEPYCTARGLKFGSLYQVNQILAEMVEALENRDYVVVGDLMNYEIKPIVEGWNEKLKSL